MKVNISGRGCIPGLNKLAPVRGVEMTEPQIARVLNYHQFSVYDASTGLYITRSNLASLFKPVITKPVVKPVETKIETPVVVEEKKEEVINIVEEPIVETIIEEPVEVKPSFLAVSDITPEEVVEDAIDVVNVVESEIVDEVESTIEEEDNVDTEYTTEETVTEDKPSYPRNKKKKRH